MADADDLVHAWEGLDDARVGLALRAGDADGGAMRARNRMRPQPQLLDLANDCFDLLRPRAGIHYDEH